MGFMVHSLLWVVQDLYLQPYGRARDSALQRPASDLNPQRELTDFGFRV